MFEDYSLSKLEILIQQNRLGEAEKLVKELLAADPDSIMYHFYLAAIKLQQDEADDALFIVNKAIGLAPKEAHLFYMKARIMMQMEDYDEAEKNIKESIALNPVGAEYFALLANVKLIRKHFQEALDIANKALELDAENILALNLRSTALLKLNKKEESFATIEGALRYNPNDSYTHANYGWGLLEKGNHKKAMEHLSEALQQDPNNEYAQAGMLEAIKAKNLVYRIFLKYAFFMSNLTAKYQIGLILGFYVLLRILRGIANTYEPAEPFITPVIILYSLLAFSTWIITPVSNLFLRFNKYGRFLLDKKERISSNLVAASVSLALIGLVLFLSTNDGSFLSICAFGVFMMLPLGALFTRTKNKYIIPLYTGVMVITGILACVNAIQTKVLVNNFAVAFMVLLFLFQVVLNFIIIRTSNK